MPTTTRLKLPYPVLADPADVPADIKKLADAVELGTLPPIGTQTQPGSSTRVDGMECVILADAAAGVLWQLRYKADMVGSYKWLFVGGSDLAAYVAAQESFSIAANTWGMLGTVEQPSIYVLNGGYYDVTWGVECRAVGRTENNGAWSCGVSHGLADPPEPVIRFAAGGPETFPAEHVVSLERTDRRLVGSGTTLYLRHKWENSDDCFIGKRFLRVRPIRLS